MATIECPGEATVDSTVTVSVVRFAPFCYTMIAKRAGRGSRIRAFTKALREIFDGYANARCQSGCYKLPMGPIKARLLSSVCGRHYLVFVKCTTKVNITTLVQCEQSEEKNMA